VLKFVASLSLCPSDIRKIRRLLHGSDVTVRPLQNVLVTPHFVNEETLGLVRELKDGGAIVYFDSGGYYVQVGRMTYEELYYPLLQHYLANPWADIYTLPDYVPTTQDSEDEVWYKVRQTVDFSSIFLSELPPSLREKAMPVVHGHTLEQVEYCLERYVSLGVKYIGFGSFGTTGKNNEANVMTQNAQAFARHVVQIAQNAGTRTHLFGVGAPALVAMIYGTEADSFDSSSWLKSAGYGQIHLPFIRGYNISHRNGQSEIQKGITVEEFERLKELTGHSCPYCESIKKLQRVKMLRALHNLVCIAESVDMINRGEHKRIKLIYANGSPKYRKEFKQWLLLN
jgi:hypothetical protein